MVKEIVTKRDNPTKYYLCIYLDKLIDNKDESSCSVSGVISLHKSNTFTHPYRFSLIYNTLPVNLSIQIYGTIITNLVVPTIDI